MIVRQLPSCDNTHPNGFRAADCYPRSYPSHSAGSSTHHRLDDRGGCGVAVCIVEGTQPSPARVRRRQCHRTLFSGGCAVEFPRRCCWRAFLKEGCPRRGSLAVRTCCLCQQLIRPGALRGYSEPRPTLAGIAILVAALAVMPWFAKEKRRLSAATGSAALRADATQSALCAYLSLIALMGLAVNAIWHMPWADPVAALLIIPLVLRESWQAIRGRPCDCCWRGKLLIASRFPCFCQWFAYRHG